MNFLPKDLVNIIQDYKNQMEEYEEQFKLINNIINEDNEETICESFNISYPDFKEYFMRHGQYHHFKFKIGIYDNSMMDNKWFTLNIRTDDDSFLNDFNIIEICKGAFNNIIYLNFGDYKMNEEKIMGLNTMDVEDNNNNKENINEEDIYYDDDEDDSDWETWLDLV